MAATPTGNAQAGTAEAQTIQLSDLDVVLTKQDLEALGAWTVKAILSRTAQGVGANGKAFKSYSKDYAKETGKTKVDLKGSGRMLSALKILKNDGVTLEVGIPESVEYAGAVDADRPFVGLSEADQKALDLFLDEIIKKKSGAGGPKRPIGG